MCVKKIIEQAFAPEEDVELDARDLFEMANLYPDTTGLPMTVWVSPRGNARHDVGVEVNTEHGNQMNITDTAVVGVRPTPRVIAGQLSPADAQAVFRMGRAEYGVLAAYWDGQIDMARMIQGLRPVAAHPTTRPTRDLIGRLAASGLLGRAGRSRPVLVVLRVIFDLEALLSGEARSAGVLVERMKYAGLQRSV